MNKNNKQEKVIILCEDVNQRNKNIDAFADKFNKEHKALMDRLAE